MFNLKSPTTIRSACDPSSLTPWIDAEVALIKNGAIRSVVELVCRELDEFVKFPDEATLLWRGCDRIPEVGKRQKYHRYPDVLKRLAKEKSVKLDTRPNGPAIASFLLRGGDRPQREGSMNAWSIHHIYSGKYPYLDHEATTHAARDGLHFTQSAGLVAAHPIADAISDEFPFFAWLLRAEAYRRFGYDPDHVFGTNHDELGFSGEKTRREIYTEGSST